MAWRGERCREKWGREVWKSELAKYLLHRRDTRGQQLQQQQHPSSSSVLKDRKPFHASILASLLLRRVREDKIEEDDKRQPHKPVPSTSIGLLRDACFHSIGLFTNLETLKLRCLDVVARNLMHYDVNGMSQYFETEDDLSLYAFSGYAASYGTMNNENIGIFSQRHCERLVLGDVSEEAIRGILPRFVKSSLHTDAPPPEPDDDWESFVPETTGCFSLRDLTFVKTVLSSSALRILRGALPMIHSLRFIAVDIRSFSEFLDELELFLSLEVLELSLATFLTPPTLMLLLNRVRFRKMSKEAKCSFGCLRSIVFSGLDQSLAEVPLDGFLSDCGVEIEIQSYCS